MCVSHVNTDTRQNTTSATSLHYPSLDSRALFLSQNYHISSPPNTPHILCSQPGDNKREILLLEKQRGGFLPSPVPSVVITGVRALLIGLLIFSNEQNGVSERVREVESENYMEREREQIINCRNLRKCVSLVTLHACTCMSVYCMCVAC